MESVNKAALSPPQRARPQKGAAKSVLATRAHAPDRCNLRGRAGSVKVVFACTSTWQLDGCGCPAATDGLDGFCPALDNSAAGAWTPRSWAPGNCCRSMAAQSFLPFAPADRRWRRRSGSASGSAGVCAVSAARAARLGRLERLYRKFSQISGESSDYQLGNSMALPAYHLLIGYLRDLDGLTVSDRHYAQALLRSGTQRARQDPRIKRQARSASKPPESVRRLK